MKPFKIITLLSIFSIGTLTYHAIKAQGTAVEPAADLSSTKQKKTQSTHPNQNKKTNHFIPEQSAVEL